MSKKSVYLVRLFSALRQQGYFCLITELDQMDDLLSFESVRRCPRFEHWETSVCDALYRLRQIDSGADIVIRVEGKEGKKSKWSVPVSKPSVN